MNWALAWRLALFARALQPAPRLNKARKLAKAGDKINRNFIKEGATQSPRQAAFDPAAYLFFGSVSVISLTQGYISAVSSV